MIIWIFFIIYYCWGKHCFSKYPSLLGTVVRAEIERDKAFWDRAHSLVPRRCTHNSWILPDRSSLLSCPHPCEWIIFSSGQFEKTAIAFQKPKQSFVLFFFCHTFLELDQWLGPVVYIRIPCDAQKCWCKAPPKAYCSTTTGAWQFFTLLPSQSRTLSFKGR